MVVNKNLRLQDKKISIVGLGYVGLPLLIEFSKKFNVVGFDTDEKRINDLKVGIDHTKEVPDKDLHYLNDLLLTIKSKDIKDSSIYIITVPTPVDSANKPNLNPIISASKTVGQLLNVDDIVIFESTVYPGCTEEICVPILESKSGLIYNSDFFCGYSPERINPGDSKYTLTKIKKITSGSNEKTSNFIADLYSSIITAGIYKASSIAVAEAAKVIENTQRDVNIALINELAIIFNELKIDTKEVLEAASTKWNFLPFSPGLVGGHCIGVDPYYLTHKASEVGYHPEIILAGRRINDNMGKFIAEKSITELAKAGVNSIDAKISILGLTFKQDCPDLRNTKVVTILDYLRKYDCDVKISDPLADPKIAKSIYNIDLVDLEDIEKQDALIIAVNHSQYKNLLDADFKKMIVPNGVLIDVKSLFKKEKFQSLNLNYWRL